MRKSLLLLALFALSAALFSGAGVAAARQQGGTPKKDGAVKKDAAAPARAEKPKVTELKEAGLRSLFEASVARKRPLLINFWATWCVPCRAEFPDLVNIRQQFAADRLDFVTVSLDDASEIETSVPDFLREVRGDAMPAFLLNADDTEVAINMLDRTWRGELPATFLFDRTGVVVYKHKGRVKPDELSAVIEKALGEKE
jgi:thiol-disulfide isomerase/thioredoxin